MVRRRRYGQQSKFWLQNKKREVGGVIKQKGIEFIYKGGDVNGVNLL